MGFTDPPRLFLRSDSKNAKNPLGKTAYYDPTHKSITIYVTGRHPKDIMRSFSHELVHHAQNCRGDFDNVGNMGEGYAQEDEHLREMEREAYETGNMCFRDWEDSIKSTIYFEHLQKGEKKMSTKDWKNKELTQLLSEAWGFKFNTLEEFDEFNGSGELQAEGEEEIEEIAGVTPKKQDRRTPKLQRDRRPDSEREDDDEPESAKKQMAEGEEEIEEIAGVTPKKQDRRTPRLQKDRRPDSDREDDEESDDQRDAPKRKMAESEDIDEGEHHDDKEKMDESDDSQAELKEAIVSLLRKHLQG
jgi:hypothetical protein